MNTSIAAPVVCSVTTIGKVSWSSTEASTLRVAARLLVGITAAVAVIELAAAADTPIYKCREATSRVLYTDEPCDGGNRLDIRAGIADPAALQRLERAREALDQSTAERAAADKLDAARKEETDRLRREAEAAQAQRAAESAASYSDYDYASGWGWYLPYPRRERPRRLPPNAAESRFPTNPSDGALRP
jgi:hypothetical protein